ncbi:proline-, glutamic acid- and leucine-rich protein 1-like isoform X5 [Branchiostoma lanceolatum]|uniref:proline-, glutamic acid- and leucine-rich protein 1-like isoform X5 n=1 Tax=Branchiostoma lanceolatum TaxID=7740 RepID=UPI003453B32E
MYRGPRRGTNSADDDGMSYCLSELVRMGILSESWGRQIHRAPGWKWWIRGEKRGHGAVLIVTEIGFISTIIGLLLGFHFNFLGPIIFAVGIISLIPSGLWLIWEFKMASLRSQRREEEEDGEDRQDGEEEDGYDEEEEPVVERRSREGVREDLPSVRDGGQIQVVVPSPPPYEEVTSQDRRHLGNQSEASDAPRPPPYASVAEVDERTRQQTSRTEEPRSSEQCPSYTEAIRSPTSGSPTDEMPSELPPVPPPAYEEVVNR